MEKVAVFSMLAVPMPIPEETGFLNFLLACAHSGLRFGSGNFRVLRLYMCA